MNVLSRAFVCAIASRMASCTPALECGPGTFNDHGVCRALNGPCGEGTREEGGVCVPITAPLGPAYAWGPNVRVVERDVDFSVQPQLAISSSGEVYVTVAAGLTRRVVLLYRSRDGGSTFERIASEQALPVGSCEDPTVAIDSADRIYWAWIRREPTTPPESRGRLFARIAAADGVFGEPASVGRPRDAEDVRDPQLSVAPGGLVHLGWRVAAVENQSAPALLFMVSRDGAPFGDQHTVEADFEQPLTGRFAFDTAGTPVTARYSSGISFDPDGGSRAITELSVGSAREGRASLASATWEVPVVRHYGWDLAPALASSPSAGLWAIYLEARERATVPVVRLVPAGFSYAPVLLEPFSQDQTRASAALPSLAVDGGRGVHAVWLDNRTGALAAYSMYSTGGTGAWIQRVSDVDFRDDGSPGRDIGGRLSIVATTTRRYAAWSDSRDGTSQVFVASAAVP